LLRVCALDGIGIGGLERGVKTSKLRFDRGPPRLRGDGEQSLEQGSHATRNLR
jgi:hypothetical protein